VLPVGGNFVVVVVESVTKALIVWSARRGGTSTPRRQGLTNGHVNGASSPAAEPASQAESSLFSSPAPRRGLLHRSLLSMPLLVLTLCPDVIPAPDTQLLTCLLIRSETSLATTPICQPMTSSRCTLPAKHHHPTGFLCGWSVGVECFARLLAWFWCWQRQIQTTFENVYVRFVLAHTAH